MSYESGYRFMNSEEILEYIKTGNAIFKLEAPSGNSHTYFFMKPVHEEDFDGSIFFVYTNTSGIGKRKYVGMMSSDAFYLTQKSRFSQDSDIAKGAEFITKMAFNQDLVDNTQMKLFYAGI